MRLGEYGQNSPINGQLEEAWLWTQEHFPLPGYIAPDRFQSYKGMAYTAWNALGGKGRVLDFGCGPLDKTAVLARLGLEVVAADTFQDSWHREAGNLDKIRGFAQEAGIELHDLAHGSLSESGVEGTFDLISLHHVLEHLADSPRELLNDLIGRLGEGGLLYLTVPNAVNLRKRLRVMIGDTNYPRYSTYYWAQHGYDGHIREYVLDDLLQLAKNQGMEVVLNGHYNHFWHAIPKNLRLGVATLCRIVPGFCDSCSVVLRKPKEWQPRHSLPQDELHQALDASVPFDYAAVLGQGQTADE